MDTLRSPEADPERQAYAQELRRVLESAVDALPDAYRTVFMLRDVEGLSTSETGEGLGLGEEAVKTRVPASRARDDPAQRQQADRRSRQLAHFSSTLTRGAIASSRSSSRVSVSSLGAPEFLIVQQ